ncbi:PCI domain-containing protein [Favolaschia claudopus]|uniref:PCI domain-containing protein n=1 Tax=Favolaschia claudopus TaxID=2862362 RepID=A0AAW0AK81_9AGAR
MQAADALSLTNRLKRAGIRGADVAHLSRTTVAGIVSDAGKQLRTTVGQDDELRAGRRDVRTLLGVLREIFGALGEMRVLLNEVVLDPSSATRVSEAAMDPSKAAARAMDGDADGKGGADGKTASGWMAPLSKLFAGSPAPREAERERVGAASPLAAPRPIPARFVPKLGPALAASATTVNVEFSGAGAGVGRAMTSTVDATPAMPVPTRPGAGGINGAPHQGTPSVMGIFAGAPRTRTPDPWVVIPHPKVPRQRPPSLLSPAAAALRAGGRHHPNRMSRNVDAVLDGVGTPVRQPGSGDASGDEEPDYLAPLLQRTLRRRGLSDSSIHSTYAAQAAEDEAAGAQPPLSPLSRTEATWLESGSVLQALSRRVQSFRSGLSVETTPQEGPEGASLSGSELGTSPPKPTSPVAVGASRRSSRASRDTSSKAISATPSGFGFLANLVPSGEAADIARSMQNNSMISRTYRAPEAGERDLM